MEFWQLLYLVFGWQLVLLTCWCPEVMPQQRVNHSLHSSLPLLNCPHFHWHKTCHVFASRTTPMLQIKAKQSKTKQSKKIFPLKNFRAAKTLDRLGMAGSDVCGWIGSIFPHGL